MLIIVYLFDIASDVTRNKEHTPLSPLKRGIGFCGIKYEERISPPAPLKREMRM